METEQRILKAAEKEFLERGFSGTSMRRIAAEAGVTTGALYGYYVSKEAIFEALVDESYNSIMERYKSAHEEFASLSPSEQLDNMGKITTLCMEWCVEYIYSHIDAFRLILMCSEGTRYSSMIDDMVAIEEESTEKFISTMREHGIDVPEIDPLLSHMITSGYFTSFFEIVRHGVSRDEAMEYVRSLQAFSKAGWEKLMGLCI